MLQDLLIRGRKRADKRDNFVKLNRDHRQQFPHYIRATPATLTITNWQAISSSSSPYHEFQQYHQPHACCHRQNPHPCFLQKTKHLRCGETCARACASAVEVIWKNSSGQWVSSRPLTLPNLRSDDQKLRCALFLLNSHKGSTFLAFFSCNVSTVGCI